MLYVINFTEETNNKGRYFIKIQPRDVILLQSKTFFRGYKIYDMTILKSYGINLKKIIGKATRDNIVELMDSNCLAGQITRLSYDEDIFERMSITEVILYAIRFSFVGVKRWDIRKLG